MITATSLDSLRAQVRGWRQTGQRIAFVPTMGNLHAGHYSLIALARQHAERVVASVFVNPTQFGPNEDFDRYPRTPEADADGLGEAGCDLLWLPSVETMVGLAGAIPHACELFLGNTSSVAVMPNFSAINSGVIMGSSLITVILIPSLMSCFSAFADCSAGSYLSESNAEIWPLQAT